MRLWHINIFALYFLEKSLNLLNCIIVLGFKSKFRANLHRLIVFVQLLAFFFFFFCLNAINVIIII